MFLKYLAPLYEPIKFIRNKFVKGQTAVGKVRVDVGRVKSYKNLAKAEAKRAKQRAKDAKGKAKGLKDKAAAKKQQWGGAAQQPQPAGAAAGGYGGGAGAPMGGAGGYGGGAGAPMGAPGGMAMQGGNPQGGYPPAQGGGPQLAQNQAPRYPGAQPGGYPGGAPGGGPPGGPGGGPGPVSGSGGIVVAGALWWKKHLCGNCGQELDKTWDRCPYCSVQASVAAPNKTQAIMMDYAGMGTGMQLLGWLVSISRGPQRGELFTLQPMTTVGTDPSCTVVLMDSYMSSRHCEIKAEGGIWVLRDLKSTNGTYVNDRRVEQHELVDNDFIKVGQSLLKFKSL